MNGVQYWPFPSTSATFYRPAELQSLPACPAGPQPIHDPLRTQSPIPLASSTPSPQSSGASDVEVLATANTKTKKPRVKSADWTEEETHELLEAWAPKFSKLQGASQREKIKIWNDMYSLYKERCPESQRTLQQVKKRQQNLDNEYKQLKQRTRSTREAGIKKIKEGFPYFDVFDEVMGHRDSIDPSKMAIEGSSTFTSEPSVNDTSQDESVNASVDESEPPDDVTEVQKSSEKRKTEKDKQEKSGHKGKRRRRDVPERTTQDWQTSFMEMWKDSMEQDNARFERSAEMFRDAQSRQMEQTNAILAGFKDIFKDLASK